MRGLWIENGLRLRTDLPEPAAPAGEALIRVRLSGVCNTDLELTRGYQGFRGVPGHEFVGEVVAAPADSGFAGGERVVGEINAGCGRCDWCRGDHPSAYRPRHDLHALAFGKILPPGPGDSRHCPNRTVLGIHGRAGAHADYLTLPVGNLRRVPDAVADEAAVFVEPLAAAVEILDQVQPAPGTRTLVLGDGKLGLLIALVLADAGCDVLAAGRHDEKLAILRARGIATTPADRVPVDRWDLVVEATGSAAGLARAIDLVRPRGTLVLKTTVAGPVTANLAPVVVDEIRLIGSRCGRFEPAIDRLAAGRIDVTPLIAARFRLTGAVAAIDRAAQPGVLKVLIEP